MDEEYLRFNEEGIAEVNPMASYNAQQAFIDNYRNAQAEKTAQIGEQAHALGSDLEAQYGGLHGPSEYWKSRYQTPQTESRLASLRSANQAQALNALMQQDLARAQEEQQRAYKNYQRRAAARAAARYRSGGGAGGYSTTTSPAPTTDDGYVEGKVTFTPLEDVGRAGTTVPGIQTVYDAETKQPTATTVVPAGFGNAAIDENGNVIYDVYTYPSDGSDGKRIYESGNRGSEWRYEPEYIDWDEATKGLDRMGGFIL